jgi:hypothetical protein
MSLWNAQDAAAATGGRAQGNWTASGVSIDTRNMAPGDLFIALKDTRDGHEFVHGEYDFIQGTLPKVFWRRRFFRFGARDAFMNITTAALVYGVPRGGRQGVLRRGKD